jgi:predicted transcriptional regulator
MYLLPQEIEVWYIIPAIRKELSKILTRKYNLTFEEAGKILGITKAAVCQYLKKKRASKLELPKEIKAEIEKSAAVLVKDKNRAVREITRIMGIMKDRKCSCSFCKKFNKEIPRGCSCT